MENFKSTLNLRQYEGITQYLSPASKLPMHRQSFSINLKTLPLSDYLKENTRQHKIFHRYFNISVKQEVLHFITTGINYDYK
jgi:hypothetical protein